MIDLRAGPATTAALSSTGDATARKRDIWSALERAHLRWPSLLPPPTPRAAGRTMEAVGAVKLDLETWKKNSAVDLHVLTRCLCRRSGGGEYLLKSTVAYQHRRGVDDAAGNFCRSNRNVMDEPRHGFPLHSARQEAPPPHLNGTIGRVTTKSTILSFLGYNL